jgi:formylglycine-generating enzyme required for sulfatase activity
MEVAMYLNQRKIVVLLTIFIFFIIGISQEALSKQKTPEKGVAGQVLASSLGMKFAYITPGTFTMGSSPNEKGRDEDENQHQVSLTRGFYMQTTEVTVGQWRVFVRDTGFKTDAETKGNAWIWIDRAQQLREGYYWDNPGFPQSDSHPVTCVTWSDTQAFIKWLNEKEGKTYRLPAEAEWEYACRAGSTARFNWGNRPDCSKANYGNGWSKECKGRNPMGTTKAGSFEPNPWGLYDMLGNVWEHCQDWYGAYPSGSATDPKGLTAGSKRSVRGGSWVNYSRYIRSATRAWNGPRNPYANLGFRLVREP